MCSDLCWFVEEEGTHNPLVVGNPIHLSKSQHYHHSDYVTAHANQPNGA